VPSSIGQIANLSASIRDGRLELCRR